MEDITAYIQKLSTQYSVFPTEKNNETKSIKALRRLHFIFSRNFNNFVNNSEMNTEKYAEVMKSIRDEEKDEEFYEEIRESVEFQPATIKF